MVDMNVKKKVCLMLLIFLFFILNFIFKILIICFIDKYVEFLFNKKEKV